MSGFQVVVFLLVWFVPHSKAHFIGVVASIGDAFMSFHVCDDFAFVLMIQLKTPRKQWWSAGYALIANPSPRIGFWAGGFNCAAGTKMNMLKKDRCFDFVAQSMYIEVYGLDSKTFLSINICVVMSSSCLFTANVICSCPCVMPAQKSERKRYSLS